MPKGVARMPRPSDLERLYGVADDHEMAVLDSLRNRAGLTWECRGEDGRSHWTNPGTRKTCEECGKPRPRKEP